MQLNSMMNLDSEMQVRAAGGLLSILQQEMIIDAMDIEDYEISPVQIESICELSRYPPLFWTINNSQYTRQFSGLTFGIRKSKF